MNRERLALLNNGMELEQKEWAANHGERIEEHELRERVEISNIKMMMYAFVTMKKYSNQFSNTTGGVQAQILRMRKTSFTRTFTSEADPQRHFAGYCKHLVRFQVELIHCDIFTLLFRIHPGSLRTPSRTVDFSWRTWRYGYDCGVTHFPCVIFPTTLVRSVT